MALDLMRFSVAMPEDLLMQFDHLVARRGLAKNRSEVVRDLVREALVEEECATPGQVVMGTLTIVFNHHASDLQEKLHTIQHDYFGNIISSMHVHLDQRNCLEVIVLRGETGRVQDIANKILGTKGVKTGRLVLTTTGTHI
ncbi:MAG: nickel-responsive transcriptional regulator NikR [Raoultibacter sp.]